jgi:dihydroorotase-like cyclic amidohydrolase
MSLLVLERKALVHMADWRIHNPADLADLAASKGSIQIAQDADFVVTVENIIAGKD